MTKKTMIPAVGLSAMLCIGSGASYAHSLKASTASVDCETNEVALNFFANDLDLDDSWTIVYQLELSSPTLLDPIVIEGSLAGDFPGAGRTVRVDDVVLIPASLNEFVLSGEATLYAPGIVDPNAREWNTMAISSKTGDTEIAVQCEQPAISSLGDTVWEDANNDGVQDAGEPGVEGVTVELYTCDDSFMAMTTTDAQGRYGFGDLPAGDYKIMVSDIADYQFTVRDQGDDALDSDVDAQGASACVSLGVNDENLTLDAGLFQPLATIGDRVWIDNNANGRQNAGEMGQGGVNVSLYQCGVDGVAGTADDNFVSSMSTDDANGEYLFTDLTPGSYYIAVERPEGYEFTIMDAVNDAVDSDVNAQGLTVCTVLEPGEEDLTQDAGIKLAPQQCDLDVVIETTPQQIIIKDSPGCEALGKPTSLTFRYTGGGCAASDNAASDADKKAPVCSGSIDDTQNVFVGASSKKGNYTIANSLVAPGETFTINAGKFEAESVFTLSNNGSTEEHVIHTSCSAPLEVGDVFGSMTLVSFNDTQPINNEATITYTVTNAGDTLYDLVFSGTPFDHNIQRVEMAAGVSETFVFSENVISNTTVTAVVTGTLADSVQCAGSATAAIDVIRETTGGDKKDKGKKGKKDKDKKGKKGKKDKDKKGKKDKKDKDKKGKKDKKDDKGKKDKKDKKDKGKKGK